MISHTQQNSANPWVSEPFSLTLHMVSHAQQYNNLWVRGSFVLLGMTNHMKGQFRLGQMAYASTSWWSSVGYDRLYQENITLLWVILSVFDLSPPKKSGENILKKHPFPLVMKCTGTWQSGKGRFEHPRWNIFGRKEVRMYHIGSYPTVMKRTGS